MNIILFQQLHEAIRYEPMGMKALIENKYYVTTRLISLSCRGFSRIVSPCFVFFSDNKLFIKQ